MILSHRFRFPILFLLGVSAFIIFPGCTSHDVPPTPMTASFDMQPVPKHTKTVSGWKQAWNVLLGKTPIKEVKMMENQDSPDQRRQGIYKLVSKEFGQHEPYTRRYRQIAQTDTDPLVRAAAIRALNESRDRQAVPIFIAGLADPSPYVRLQAAKALSNVPDPTAADPLSRTLGNTAEQKDVRIAAAEALRNYRQIGVARVLAATLSGRDFSVAWQSRWSLRILTGADYKYDEHAWLAYLTGPTKPLG